MKTIQEYLKTCDRKKVIDIYINKYTFGLIKERRVNFNLTISQIAERQQEELNRLIDRLIAIDPAKDNDSEEWILMTVHCAETEGEDLDHILVRESDVFDDCLKRVDSYAFDLTPFATAAGYYVADTYLTQYYISELIAYYLFEVSSTGYEQEKLEQTVKDLDKALREIENGHTKGFSIEEFEKELEEEYGLQFEEEDPRVESARKDYYRERVKYSEYCRTTEIGKLRELLKEERL